MGSFKDERSSRGFDLYQPIKNRCSEWPNIICASLDRERLDVMFTSSCYTSSPGNLRGGGGSILALKHAFIHSRFRIFRSDDGRLTKKIVRVLTRNKKDTDNVR